MGMLAAVGVLAPFPFYYWLWTQPQSWVNLCGKGQDPSKVMAYVSHFLKLVQFISLFSVSLFSWPPPLYFWPLFTFGQFLNFRVYQLLGESGTYYGVRFGKSIPWVTEFPFGVINDPQYMGSIKHHESSCLSCLGSFSIHSSLDSGIHFYDASGIKRRSINSCEATLLTTLG